VADANWRQHSAGQRHNENRQQDTRRSLAQQRQDSDSEEEYEECGYCTLWCKICDCKVADANWRQHSAGQRHNENRQQETRLRSLAQQRQVEFQRQEAARQLEQQQRAARRRFNPVRRNVHSFMEGSRPRQSSGPDYKVDLLPYDVPQEIDDHIITSKDDLFQPKIYLKLQQESRKYAAKHCSAWCATSQQPVVTLGASIDPWRYLAALLFVEEAQQHSDMHRYDIEGYVPTAERSFWKIQCDGLAEKRPSVMRGDVVWAVSTRSSDVFKGYVHFEPARDEVVVSFGDRYCGDPINVFFSIARVQFRQQHRALEVCKEKGIFLRSSGMDQSTVPQFNIPSGNLAREQMSPKLNTDQKDFLMRTTASESPRLLCLWGPPGTGKTTTLCHTAVALLQCGKLFSHHGAPRVRILFCTPSNFSADNVCETLYGVAGGGGQLSTSWKVLRVNSLSRKDEFYNQSTATMTAPQRYLAKCSLPDQAGGFAFPTQQVVDDADIVVCTLGTVSRVFGIGAKDTFTHIFVDEAGQANDAELLCALQFANPLTRTILGGDHKQLNPIVRSKVAVQYGFSQSSLERLFIDHQRSCANDVAATSSSSSSSSTATLQFVMLKVNYRSHPHILSLVNLTYDNQLVQSQPFPSSKWRDQPAVPRVTFMHVEGKSEQEADSPSWMNLMECNAVLSHVVDLVKGKKVSPTEIVILAPYAKQCQKIRQKLHYECEQNLLVGPSYDKKHSPFRVCTVEAFQGRESRYVILSLVRSSREYAKHDAKHNLGFLNQPKRANVAVSRAIDFLTIFGNATVMCTDPFWYKIVEAAAHIQPVQAYDERKPFTFVPKVAVVDVPDAGDDSDDEDDGTVPEDQGWSQNH
jgi:helicase MOV-10